MNQETKPAVSAAEQKAFSPPSISLPKGGGAIRGLGEKFGANPVTGTASISVPIATSPGRSGFGPELSLSYDSGSGNGPFGFGWSLALPSIARKTDKGLPTYQDARDSDVFLLSGSEDLVPVLGPDGRRLEDTTTDPDYTIHRYRPRLEGLFARIERWTHRSGEVHWRSLSKDNVLTVYGKDENSQIYDPADPHRVFRWLIAQTRDDKGQAVIYQYKPEDGAGVDLARASERNRGEHDDPRRGTNRYLKRIHYGNRTPLFDETGRRSRFLTDLQIQNAGWMFEVVFDYGEHDPQAPSPGDPGPWALRPDPFSTYRAGFEVRTTRRCERVLVFHHFPDEPDVGTNCLVRSTDFTYSSEEDPADARNPVYTFLQAVSQTGYRRTDGGYTKRSLPPLEFEYSRPVVQEEVGEVDASSLDHLPVGVDGSVWQWTDLHGEGIPGILTEQGGAWFYKRNLSPVSDQPVEFAPQELVTSKPGLTRGTAQFMDLAGDGLPDLVVLDDPTPGLYEHDEGEGWQPFRPFPCRLHRETHDPNLRFIDLNGDGQADVLITEEESIVWHPSLGEDGFGEARRVAQALDEEKGPRVVFADGRQSIYLADLSGDGLTDLVRVRNGEVSYWPNLGYGRFGAKVTMDQSPWFDEPEQFDQRRIRLADIDGTGTTDLIYLHRDGVRLYFNQSGNGWSAPKILEGFPQVDDLASIAVTDLLGNGTACLVWSSALAGDARRQMRYLDLMGGQKPHLLVKTANNLGAETRLGYAPSTKFYLADKRAGKPWITRLPFPVHVVERVETYDRISRNRFVARYSYHHGHFDGVEREFRGFGMVEQWDTEEFAALGVSGEFPTGENIDATSHVPPVLTKTWFHTGAYTRSEAISRHFEAEYYREPGLSDLQFRAQLLPDTILPAGLTREEEREACRSLKGAMLRQEVYALDGSPKAGNPYTVIEQNVTIRLLQARGINSHAVFSTHPREVIKYYYERNPADPRIQHALSLEVDNFGNVLKEAAISYGRRLPDAALPLQTDRDKQTRMAISYTENRVTNPVDTSDDHWAPRPCETRTFELTGYTPENHAARFSFDEWTRDGFALPGAATEIQYEQAADDVSRQKRLIEHARTLYSKDDLTALLPLAQLEPLALPGESYKLAFTPGLLAQAYQREGQPLLPDPAAVLGGQGTGRGGYVSSQDMKGEGTFPGTDPDDYWWIPTGRVFMSPGSGDDAAQELAYARNHFFLPHRYRNAFGHTNTVTYDAYDLLMLETRDPLGNRVTAGERLPDGNRNPAKPGNDYRLLQPWLLMDANRNRAQVVFDTFGMVAGTAVLGKPEEDVGDRLDGFQADLTEAALLDLFANPLANPHIVLGHASTRMVYDPFAYHRSKSRPDPQPAAVYSLAREIHDADLEPGTQTRILHSFSYSDGFGREIQKKIQAEPGPVPRRDANGKIVVGADGQPEMTANDVAPRWVGSGWTVFNNKGKPVRQFEPFFTDKHGFEFDARMGVSPVLFYDGVERVVATVHPNHTWQKTVFNPWHQETWDVNDSVRRDDPKGDPDVGDFFRRLPETEYLPTWYQQRQGGGLGTQEQAAAGKAEVHAETPAIAWFDSRGRTFLTFAHNRLNRDGALVDEKYASRVELDIEGNERSLRDAVVQDGDARGRIVMRYDYDLLGNRVHQASMESGERWTLSDATGKPIRAWDSRGDMIRREYDALRRPVRTLVTGADPVHPDQALLTERLVYGEQHPEAELRNLRTRLHLHLDQAGAATNEAHDFKGNLLRYSRRIATEYRQALDWSAVDLALPPDATAQFNPAELDAALAPRLEADTYTTRTTHDGLNRPVTVTTPETPGAAPSVIRAGYNEARLLERIDVNLNGATTNGQPAWTPFVLNIDYDAKGQRRCIELGNGVSTFYEYDPLTFRLTHLVTRRNPVIFPDDSPQPPVAGWPGSQVQNLRYTYDPAGNVTHIRDEAQQTIFFRNKRIEPSAEYTYDALYRLIQATGREHLGQGGTPAPHSSKDLPRVSLSHPGDGNAMGTYLELYVYDAVGNFLEMQHQGVDPADPGWTRTYAYDEASLIEPAKRSNRLSSSTVGDAAPERYLHDAHGNITRMPHLGGVHPASNMHWNYRDQLQQIDLAGAGGTAYFTYDGSGRRLRKVWEKAPGLTEERIYLGAFEIYRRRQGGERLERETLHLMDDEQRVALIETRTLDTAGNDPAPPQLIRYQFGNQLGSACLELDDQAQVISYEEYTPYGSTSYQAVRSQTELPKRYRYTGTERDEESGLGYHTTRYYASWLGRWTAADPGGLADGPNLYRYSRDNPLLFSDPRGTEPPPRSRYSLGDFRLSVANPVTDPLAHASYFDAAFPGVFGVAFNALDLGNRTTNPVARGFLNLAEFGVTGLLFYGPTVYSHEWGGHVGGWERLGVSAEVTRFSWFGGEAGPTGSTAGVTAEQRLAISAAGGNQQALNAAATYNRVARFGYYTPQDAWAYFLGQAGTAAYALRTLTLASPPPEDDMAAYARGARSWSVEGIATASTLTALPALAGLLWSGYQFVFNNRRSIEVPSLQIGNARLSFPNTQTLLTSSGTVLGVSSMLTFGGGGPSLLLGVDVRPTSDPAVALSVRTYGLHIPRTPVQINPHLRFTAADPPGIFGGAEVGVDVVPWLTLTGGVEAGVNDLRSETEGRTGAYGFTGGAVLRW
jgi:RHS repeat-associated protein